MAENKQILEGRQNELEVGTSVSFFVGEDNNKKIAEGEIIGLEGSKATVVYIAPSGEYSIDKFELKDLSPNGESLKLSENPDEKKVSTQEELLNKDKENEENEELEKKQEKHIQSIKNTLMTIFNVTISDKTDQTKKQIAEHKENIIIKINEIIDSTEINAENISEITDHDITILSENLDFINELIFASFIDYSIATSEKKPSTLVIEEIKTRISHFDTQAKALRDKKITEINQELYNSRSTDEKKYPKPFEMMNIGILTDERAKKLNIDITHQKIFNRILEREKNERDNIINPLVQKIVKRRKDLSILLKEDHQNLSKKNTEFTKTIPELSTMLLSMENENGTLQATETMHDIVYKQLADIDNPTNKNKNTANKEKLEKLNSIQLIERRVKTAIESPFNFISNFQQYGKNEGIKTLFFSQISSIINVVIWAKEFSQTKNIDAQLLHETIMNTLASSTTNEIIDILREIITDFTTNAITENMEEMKIHVLKKLPELMQKIIPSELKKGSQVLYTDKDGIKHIATIQAIASDLPQDDRRYHITLSVNTKIILLTPQDNSEEISNLEIYKK